MKTPRLLLFFVALLVSFMSPAQQSPSPQPTPAQVRPCTTAPTAAPAPANNTGYMAKLRQKYDDKVTKLGANGPVPLPGSDDINNTLKTNNAPCPPAVPPTQQVSASHLPIGVITTWLCNPIVTSTDPSHTVTFITPDALTSAEPAQANAFEADGAKADPKATLSCANLRRDPKNNKVFLAQ